MKILHSDTQSGVLESEVEKATLFELSDETLVKLADLLAERLSQTVASQVSKRYLSRKEFAASHGIGIRTVDRMIEEGKLKIQRAGKRVLIPVET